MTMRLIPLLLLCIFSFVANAQPDLKTQISLDTAIARAFRIGTTNRDSSILQLQNISLQCQKEQYTFGQASAIIACGVLYVRSEGSAAPAISYFQKAKGLLNEAAKKDRSILARWYTCMGAAYAKTGLLDSAMNYYTLSLEENLQRNEPDNKGLLQNYLNLVVIYYEQEQFDQVLFYLQKIEQISKDKKEFKQELLNAYEVAAGVYVELKKFDSSEIYLNLADHIQVQRNDVQQKMMLELKGIHLLHKNKPAAAIELFKASISINDAGSAVSLKGLGNAYLKLKNYKLAEQYLFQAKEQEEALRKNTSFLVETEEDIATLFYETGRFKEAYHYRAEAAKMAKVLMDEKRSKMINQLEAKYRAADLSKQIATKQLRLLSIENKLRTKNIYFIIAIVIVLILTIIILLLRQKQKAQAHINASQLQQQEIQKLKAVLDAEEKERSRIGRELHDDIMGQISIIRMNIESLPNSHSSLKNASDYQDIKELLDNAGRDIRQTAHNLIPDNLLAEGLVQAIFYFCTNVQRRTGIAINFQHYGYETMLTPEHQIGIYRITQELIQNVIKHARAKNILLQLNQREDMLTLTVEDDGIGYASAGPSKGMGLKSIYTRLKTMNGQIDIHARQPHGTSVTIEINTNNSIAS